MPPGPLGSIELVATSNTPQPQAQAWTTPGTAITANKPPPIFTAVEFNFLFFIFQISKVARTHNGALKLEGKHFARAGHDASNQARLNQTRNPRGGGVGGF